MVFPVRRPWILSLPVLLCFILLPLSIFCQAGEFHCRLPRTGDFRLRILVTNDVHGHVFEEAGTARLGYAKLDAYARALRREGYTVWLMDAGDAFSGSAVAQFDSGLSVAGLMGKLGYRAVAPGNHAFDYNAATGNPLYYSEVLLPALAAASPEPCSAVCLNLSRYGKPVAGISPSPLVLMEGGSFRLIVCGLLTPYTLSKTNHDGLDGYDFGLVTRPDGTPDHEATRQNILRLLVSALDPYGRPGDVVVVLSHLGWDRTEDYAHGQISGRDLASVPNVDFIVDSHSHKLVPAEQINGVFYGIAGRYLEHFAEITIIRTDGVLQTAMEIKSYLDLAQVEPSFEMLEHLRAVSDRLGLGNRLFQLPADIDISDTGINAGSTPLGRFVCRGLAEITESDLALYNSGGIRSGLTRDWVTVGDIYDMIPFQNDLVDFPMTGEEILAFFNALPARGTNAFPQSYGMTVYAWERGDGGLSVAGILDGSGRPLEPTRTYRVAANSFMATRGDGYALGQGRVTRNHGDGVTRFIKHLKDKGWHSPEQLMENRSLLVFPGREAACAAYDAVCMETPLTR